MAVMEPSIPLLLLVLRDPAAQAQAQAQARDLVQDLAQYQDRALAQAQVPTTPRLPLLTMEPQIPEALHRIAPLLRRAQPRLDRARMLPE